MPKAAPALAKAERKYLERHAEPEAELGPGLAATRQQRHGHVLVIPCYGEGRGIERTLASIPAGTRGPVMTIIVVNESDDAPDWVRDANCETLRALRGAHEPLARAADHVDWLDHARGSLLLIDRTATGQRLPRRQGVGLARKIGCDVALAIGLHGGLGSAWIHCTDADALLPEDYFERIDAAATEMRSPTAAFIYDFEHDPDVPREQRESVLRYEVFLRYLLLGLRSAGSPFAHHSLGSTLAIEPGAYARVRGFPRRLAAEDFHLLNKLAKVGAIESLHGEPIVLSARDSERTPFGTAAAIRELTEARRRGHDRSVMNPRAFASLGVWIDVLTRAAATSLEAGGRSRLESLLKLRVRDVPGVDAEALGSCLDEMGLLDTLGGLLESGGGGAPLLRRLHERFDGLQTLRLIHRLADHGLPNVPLEVAIERADFLGDDRGLIGDWPALRSALSRREREGTALRRSR